MRRDGIPYVSNGVCSSPYPAVPLQDMTLEEIKKKYLKSCAKANGDPAVCSKCTAPCEQGKRAVQLVANQVYNDPPVPLYGGKTLIEKAREENMLRRQKLEEEKKEKEKMETKTVEVNKWYEEAMASDNPIEFIAQRFNISNTKAAKKLYQYRYAHKLTDKTRSTSLSGNDKVSVPAKENSLSDSIEAKMESLMKLQEKHKNIMLEMQAQYEKAKEKYEETKKKVDILCSAMDIMNE